MPRTAIDICNRALARVGADDITSLTGSGAEARACNREYEETLLAALTAPGGRPFRWGFAKAQAALSRAADTPVGRWSYAWQVPPDALMLDAVLVGGYPIAFDRLDDLIFCEAESDVVAEYAFRPEPDALPSYFVEALTTELAAKLALGLNRDDKLAATLERSAMGLWAAARSAEGQARTTRRIRAGRLLAGRFGGPGSTLDGSGRRSAGTSTGGGGWGP